MVGKRPVAPGVLGAAAASVAVVTAALLAGPSSGPAWWSLGQASGTIPEGDTLALRLGRGLLLCSGTALLENFPSGPNDPTYVDGGP